VPGSPNGQGNLKYLGDDVAKYQRIYELKSKEDSKAWVDFVQLCKVLNETPSNKLEAALAPLLDIDGVLRFLALENALINNDGYWVRTSDYNIYQDAKGKFHILPHDMNETFARPGRPGFGGVVFGPAMPIAAEMFSQGDKNSDKKLTGEEFVALAGAWFDKLDKGIEGKVTQEQFTGPFLVPAPNGAPGGDAPVRGGFQPKTFAGPGLFDVLDRDKDGTLTRAEMSDVFSNWFAKWDAAKAGMLTEEKVRAGLTEILPGPPPFGRGRGGRGPGGGIKVEGVKLDPLVAANDPDKPLISKLLAVPALRTRYLGYVRDIADKWLDWKNLGPLAQQYQSMIAADVRADTRKLDSSDDFVKSLTEDISGKGFGPGGGGSISLKSFADQRRTFLLDYPESLKPARP